MRDLLAIFNDFKDGDSNAYLELIEHIKPIIHSVTRRNPLLERDEIISEIYIMLSNRKNDLTFESPQHIISYLKQSIYGWIRNSSDKSALIMHRECEYSEALQNTIPHFDDSYETAELLDDKPFLRERILEDKTYEEIASKYNVSLSFAYRTTKKNEAELRNILKR